MAENGKGEFWAFLAGMLAGGVVAILYAPAKGEEVREKVLQTTGELKEKGEEFYSHFRAEADKLIAQGKTMLEEVSAAGKEKYQETLEKLEETREKLDEVRSKGAEKVKEVTEKISSEKKTAKKSSK